MNKPVSQRIWEELDTSDVVVLTVFNEDEILFVETLEEQHCTAAENWYASLGFGVCKETLV